MEGNPHMTSIQQALSAVMAALPSIGKADKSPEGYQYRGIEAITSRLQPLLAQHGIIIVPRATIVNVLPSPAMREGWQDIHMTVDWVIIGPAGDSITATTCGIGRDRADKGANKAHTQAFKYLLLTLFAIADRADDSEAHDTRVDADPAPAPSAKRTRKATTPDHAAMLAELVRQLELAGFTTRETRLAAVSDRLGRSIASASDLTIDDLTTLLQTGN